MRFFIISVAIASTLLATSAFSTDAPQLPASAKKLSGKDIVSLYDGSTVTFNNFTMALPLTGTVTYDLKSNTHHVNYLYGSSRGETSGPIRVIGDQFCHQETNTPESCVFVYTDGDYIYEVNAKGVVESQNQKQ